MTSHGFEEAGLFASYKASARINHDVNSQKIIMRRENTLKGKAALSYAITLQKVATRRETMPELVDCRDAVTSVSRDITTDATVDWLTALQQ
ncbi:hypothetical protein GCM10020219_006120 [Nonomuraea dietziae]